MSKYFVCCNDCFEHIGRNSTNAARLWLDLCALRANRGNVVRVKSTDFAELRKLERLGYIVTTDQPNHILIKVNGYHVDENGQEIFCLNVREHA